MKKYNGWFLEDIILALKHKINDFLKFSNFLRTKNSLKKKMKFHLFSDECQKRNFIKN